MLNRQSIIQTLRRNTSRFEQLGVRNIGLFGSYVRDEQHPDSDIDLFVAFEKGGECFENYMALYDLLEQVFAPYRIELVSENSLSPYIGPHILKEVCYA